MRILFVSQLFDPENAIKGLSFVKKLVELGHEVEVVTTFPSYPGGRVYAGYKQSLYKVEDLDGVRVVRLPTYISHGSSAIKRLVSYFSFAFVSTVYSLFFARKADVIYAYYPPVMVGVMARVVRFFRRTPYVYDVQDLWPEALVATGNLSPESRVIKAIEKVCGWIYRGAARVVVLSEGYRQKLKDKGVSEDKLVKIYNWCDESRISSVGCRQVEKIFDKNKFNILYAGNLGAAQALEYVIDAAKTIQDRGDERVHFIFLGAGIARSSLENRSTRLDLKNVTFIDPVPVDEVGSYLEFSDALLVHLADAPVFSITIPQKTQAYMMAGKPIIMAVNGEAGNIVNDARAGFVVPPCDHMKIADAAIQLSQLSAYDLSCMAENGKNFYSSNMSMQLGVGRVENMLIKVVNDG